MKNQGREPIWVTKINRGWKHTLSKKKNFFVSLPAEEAHHKCHPTKGIMGFSQRVHPEVIAKIQEFVSIGTIEPVEVQHLLKHHVKHYMFVGNLPDRAYYPSPIHCKKMLKN